MNDLDLMRYLYDAPAFAREVLDFHPDPVQLELLNVNPSHCLLNCTRQWGKSTITAVKALHQAICLPDSFILVLSPSERQSGEFIQKVADLSRQTEYKPKGDGKNTLSLRFPNRSRIVGVPSKAGTVRGFSKVALLLIDEASRVPDELYQTVRPMLAVSRGALWLISTPAGRRGFFYEAWASNDPVWTRVSVPATSCPRIPEAFLESERRALGDRTFRQEYLCEFHNQSGQIISREDIDRALSSDVKPLPISLQPRVTPLPRIMPKDPPPPPLLPEELKKSRLYLGIDFGQSHNFSTIGIVERTWWETGPQNHWDYERTRQQRFAVRHLERFALGTPYLAVISRLHQLIRALGPKPNLEVAVDATGLGRPLVELIRSIQDQWGFHPIVITPGDRESLDGSTLHVPKSHLLTALILQFEGNMFKVSSELSLAPVLLEELAGLRVKVSQAGNELFSPTPGEHDDLVFAVALANWLATRDYWRSPEPKI